MKKLLVVIAFLPLITLGQTSADWWYFGYEAGIHFTNTGPVANIDGEMETTEGCASISDEFGNLLFYTRGDTVWDSTHTIMQNGIGLLGNGIAGEGSMNSYIVPRPEHPNEFYLFSVRSFFGGMWYSKVDMTLNGGLGAVVATEKNIPLVDSTTEMVTCVRKPNNRDFWVIAMRRPGDTAYAFEVTPSGLNTTPVKSNTGLTLEQEDDVGYLKASQQSDKLAMTLLYLDLTQVNAFGIHLYDVDNASGMVSYDLMVSPTQNDTFNYGVEFSPNGQFLYIQSIFNTDCRQYDLNAGNAAAISASEVLVGPSATGSGGGALQIGPDGKIYVARNTQFKVAAIEFPNNAGPLCGYNHDAVDLNGRLGGYGLPSFPPFFIQGGVSLDDACFGDTVFFTSNYLNADSVFWNFGDPTSGTNDTSTSATPFHVYTDTGTFLVTHIAYDAFLSDTTELEVRILPRQSLNLPEDTLACNGLPIQFDLGQPGVLSYLWNGDTGTSTFVVNDTGTIQVDLIGVCDTFSQSINVQLLESALLDLGLDTVLCGVDSVIIGDSIPASYDISWNTGQTSSFIEIAASGDFILTASNACDTLVDTINVTFTLALPDSLLPEDTLLCENDPLILSRPTDGLFNYVWKDGSTQRDYTVDSTETVWLSASNECGTYSDTVRITYNGEITTELGNDTGICVDDSILLVGTDSMASYIWNTGDTTDSVWTVPGEDANYVVTVTLGACQKVSSKRISHTELSCPNINCDVEYGNYFTPNGDGLNDRFRVWSDCDVFSFDMAIYNRWGQLVNYTRNISFGWDGTINGEPAAEGTYYFVLEYRDLVVVDADRNLTQGSFTLMR